MKISSSVSSVIRICFRHLVLLEIISFGKLSLKRSDVERFLFSFVGQTSGGFFLKNFFIFRNYYQPFWLDLKSILKREFLWHVSRLVQYIVHFLENVIRITLLVLSTVHGSRLTFGFLASNPGWLIDDKNRVVFTRSQKSSFSQIKPYQNACREYKY